MMNFTEEILLETAAPVEFIDITERVRKACKASGVREGLAAIFTCHTTTAVKINENCPRLIDDMNSFLGRCVPDAKYRHDEKTLDSRANARGHIMSLFLNTSETVPVSKGRLTIGSWQSIFFVELDGPRNKRQVTIKIIGE